MGQPKADDEAPMYSGDFDFETIHAFNLYRDPAAESMEESPYLGIRKMMEKKFLCLLEMGTNLLVQGE